MSVKQGTLYVVATPLGNLSDMAPRAVQILGQVECIAAEDTRHSQPLLRHFGIGTACIALHEHNERDKVAGLIERLMRGESIALISDAGTPLISDPGYPLVRAARERGINVVPVPGPCALVVALSVSGLPTDRFVFEGFLPAKQSARVQRLQILASETRTLVFYESTHRILETLGDMVHVFGVAREVVVARELTKTFETVRGGALEEIIAWMSADANQQKGEFVILLHGATPPAHDELDAETQRIAALLAEALPSKDAARLTAAITGRRKNELYDFITRLRAST